MRARYCEYTNADEIMAHVAELAPRTVVFDVEPLIAYWDTNIVDLDEGISRFIGRVAEIPSVRVIAFATNSNRRPSEVCSSSSIQVLYRDGAMKPFWLRPFRSLPRPGVLVGDQVATDGVLAYRLGYDFVRYRLERKRLPVGPRLMGLLGVLLRPLFFRM